MPEALSALSKLTSNYELIIVDDGSTNGTAEMANKFSAENRAVKVIHHGKNLGYGAALQTGFRNSSKSLICYIDGDDQYEMSEMERLLKSIESCDVVSAYRIHRRDPLIRKVYSSGYNLILKAVFRWRIKDVNCGFKLYRKGVLENINFKSTGILIDAEMLYLAMKKGYKICQIGVAHRPRLHGKGMEVNLKMATEVLKELYRFIKQIKKSKADNPPAASAYTASATSCTSYPARL